MGKRRQYGFSLLEVIVAVAITLVIMLVLFTGLNQVQRRYRGEQLLTEVSDGIRGVVELMSQEISLAGLHGFETRTLTAPVVGSPTAQAVVLDDTTGIFVGQKLLVDIDASQETVEVTGISGSTVTGAFRRAHLAGAAVNTVGPFPTGVLPGSTATVLRLYGDLYDDGALIYVEYRVTGNTLVRSQTSVGAIVQNAADVLLENVVGNPGGTPVFQYGARSRLGRTYVTQVAVTLTSETSTPDPETGDIRDQTVSFVVVPRNVMAAFQLHPMVGGDGFVQNQPPGLPIPIS